MLAFVLNAILFILVGAALPVSMPLPAALALSVADLTPVDKHVSIVAYGVVLLSLVIQGGLIAPVARAQRIEAAG